MTDALKQSAQQALDLLDLATNYHSNRDRAAETLRAALAAPQPAAPAQVEVFSEHDKGILRDLEAMAADKSSGFWPQILAVGSLRIIKRLAAPQWKPIETAPKDGSEILLCSKKGRIANGVWMTATDRVGAWLWPYIKVEPTHWMPLPAAPGIAAPQGEQQ